MTDLTDFITHAFKTIARAVAEAGVNADLFKQPELISKTLKHRVSAELKRLAVLLRRLIFLMALQVELAPVKPRLGNNYFEKSEGEPEARKAFFSVLPTPASEAAGFPARADHRADAWPRARCAADRPLGSHARHAQILGAGRNASPARSSAGKRMASPALHRAHPKTHAMPAPLGLVSGALTVQLIEALRDWPPSTRAEPAAQSGSFAGAPMGVSGQRCWLNPVSRIPPVHPPRRPGRSASPDQTVRGLQGAQ
jgi:hypothetical protein